MIEVGTRVQIDSPEVGDWADHFNGKKGTIIDVGPALKLYPYQVRIDGENKGQVRNFAEYEFKVIS